MPVWGVWIPSTERFGFSCAPHARKARNIAANDQVVVTNDDTVNCVSIEGHAAGLDGDELEHTARAWAVKYADDGLKEEDLCAFFKQNAAYQITPDRAFGIVETPGEFASSATRWIWD